MRRLLCTDRVLPPDRVDEYLALWARLRNVAVEAGMRAWLFRADGRADHFLEFIEWDAAVLGDSAAARPEVDSMRRELEGKFGGRSTAQWEEVRPS
jgi:hypothetical protein